MKITYLLVTISFYSLTVFAEGTGTTNLEMSGVITDASCNISVDNANKNIFLGDVLQSTFSTKGSTSAPKIFTINLDSCSESITGGKVSFSGDADINDPDLIKLIDTGTQATGVAVQLLDQLSNQIPINTVTSEYFLAPGDNVLTFYLRYKSTTDKITPGDANAVLYFDMNYE